ncbi:uncharacterized, partial [Tachysurus ichikawai]
MAEEQEAWGQIWISKLVTGAHRKLEDSMLINKLYRIHTRPCRCGIA